MSEEVMEAGLQSLDQVIPVIDQCVQEGIFSFHHISEQIDNISAIGALASSVEDGQESEATEKFNELAGLIENLSGSMCSHLNDLKDFMANEPFYEEAMNGSLHLLNLLKNHLTNPGYGSTSDFMAAHGETNPVELGYRLVVLLNGDTTNPLKKALMPNHEFDTWKNVLSGFFSQLLFIEAYAYGLSLDENLADPHALMEETEDFEMKCEMWRNEHQTSWPDNVLNFIETVQDNENIGSCDEMADLIREGLEKIDTEDVFYVLVFPNTSLYVLHSTLSDQVVTSCDRGLFNVIVYKSIDGKYAGEDEWNGFRDAVDQYREVQKINNWVTDEDLENWANGIENNGFVVILETMDGMAVRSTKTDQLENGPGYGITVTLTIKSKQNNGDDEEEFVDDGSDEIVEIEENQVELVDTTEELYLLVGYK
ncbi:hypothetical protein GCK72_015475 [Caenorhabditis remanei]|uniref:Uncharacterized protein n=1 Tax=Caenorhabditis remanei TaxID=31234 RepID=A0A6A5GWY2_CAERE|nr:hypothetical protein GCK72_015475 [Caenorhabditis remanei]KAF1759015.1 hypothetical protein GCK72_015475 [Caenorhabditis remanei]